MRKSKTIKILSLVLVLIAVVSLAGCGPKDKVKDAVYLFVEQANQMNIDGIIDNLAVETLREMRGNKMLDVFLAEKTDAEIAAAIVKRIVPFVVDDPVLFLKTMKVEYSEADIRGDFSALYCSVTFTNNGVTVTKDGVFNMVRKNVSEPWKVRDIAL